MSRGETFSRGVRLLAVTLGFLVVGISGGGPDGPAAGNSVPGAVPAPPSEALRLTWPAKGVATAATAGQPQGAEIPGPSEDGKEPRPAPAIPLPSVLPSPRIDLPVAPDGRGPVPGGWSLKEFIGKAKIKVERIGEFFAVRLHSERASFSLHKDIDVDVNQYPYLSWAWRVDALPPQGDVRKKDTDDQAAQVYVVFPRWPPMLRSQIIGYIWDSTAPPGTVLTSPSNRMAKIIVLRSGSDRLGQWVTETRNVLEDYRRLYGENPPKAGKVSLLINSQNTKSTAEAWFSALMFTRSPLQREMGLPAEVLPGRVAREPAAARSEHLN